MDFFSIKLPIDCANPIKFIADMQIVELFGYSITFGLILLIVMILSFASGLFGK
jgi:hypothetical protein